MLLRGGFWIKAGLIAATVAAADVLIFEQDGIGVNVGLLTLSWVVALGLATPAVLRDRLGQLALLAAALLALAQFERPSAVALLLYAIALGVAALAPRAPRGEDGWRWLQRLVVGAVVPVAGPFLDVHRLQNARRRNHAVRVLPTVAAVALPAIGGLTFVGLFAVANPVIGDVLDRWRIPRLDVGRIVFWAFAAFPVFAILRPRGLRHSVGTPGLDGELALPFAGPGSIAASLAVFNLIFAVQNGLDVAFLWSGAGLPKGVSFADYAHQGAYPLVATALLAGLFVLVFLRPGSRTAASRPIRILVSVWIAQNLFLLASTVLRTLDYVGVYSLTRMRIAALLWMALVAVGLVLILWRLLRNRSASWLINANVAAAASVLLACSLFDLGAVAAAWNVRHAKDLGGAGVELDLCYMRSLGGAALVSLAEVEHRDLPPSLQDRIQYTRRVVQAEVAARQSHWRSWRWRDARRLSWAALLIYEAPQMPATAGRDCSGAYAAPAASPPLTPAPNPRT